MAVARLLLHCACGGKEGLGFSTATLRPLSLSHLSGCVSRPLCFHRTIGQWEWLVLPSLEPQTVCVCVKKRARQREREREDGFEDMQKWGGMKIKSWGKR